MWLNDKQAMLCSVELGSIQCDSDTPIELPRSTTLIN